MEKYKELYLKLKRSFEESYKEFLSSTYNVKEIQEQKLIGLLEKNKSTEIGKKYSFGKVKSINDYQNSLPISKYDEFEEYINKIRNGNKNVLTYEQVDILLPSSGSTSPSKYIPYTRDLISEFQKGIFPWLFDIFNNRPNLLSGPLYWSITPADKINEISSGGIPIGFGDDTSYFSSFQKDIISKLSAVPFEISQISDINEFREKTVSYLLENRNLTFISIWNPTFLSLLLRQIENPDKIWTNLDLISMWTCGNAKNYIRDINNLFPNTQIQGKGLIATEGFVSFPLIGFNSPVLSINSHFFEFKSLENNEIKLSHELERNKQYEVIITTGGGLYRYNLEDIIEVKGYHNQCPLIEFIGRNNFISDIFGEKLNERHVEKSLNTILNELSISSSYFLLSPERDSEGQTYYTLFLESKDDIVKLRNLGKNLEKKLWENFHYQYCRKLGQLDECKVFLIDQKNGKKASDVFLEINHINGNKLGNVKPLTLNSKFGWSKIFSGRFIN